MVGTAESLGGPISRGLPAVKQQICYEVDGYKNRHERGKVLRRGIVINQKNEFKIARTFIRLFRDGNKLVRMKKKKKKKKIKIRKGLIGLLATECCQKIFLRALALKIKHSKEQQNHNFQDTNRPLGESKL